MPFVRPIVLMLSVLVAGSIFGYPEGTELPRSALVKGEPVLNTLFAKTSTHSSHLTKLHRHLRFATSCAHGAIILLSGIRANSIQRSASPWGESERGVSLEKQLKNQ